MSAPAPAVAAAPGPELAAAHAQFSRAALWIYLGTAAGAVGLLLTALVTDLAHEKSALREVLSLETQVRAHYLSRHLQLLAGELTRLGLRSEVNLLDENLEPERSLLRLSHEKSAFFDVGVAILGPDGERIWAEPQTFVADPGRIARDKLLDALRTSHAVQIVPAPQTPGKASVLFVASPIMRGGQFTGALLGAIDLASGGVLERDARAGIDILLALATRDGAVIYPRGPLTFTTDPSWRSLPESGVFIRDMSLSGRRTVVAGAPVQGTDFTLVALADADRFFGPARRRLVSRAGLGLGLAALPLVGLLALFRRSLRVFRRSEEDAMRNERLRSLGAAVDLIAHEVKNSLNGLRVGLDMVLRNDRSDAARNERAVRGLRTEIERLSDFTTELLSFSKGVVPRPVSLELGSFVTKVAELARDTAESRGIALQVAPCPEVVRVYADPSLIHVALTNLVGNALDFASQDGAAHPHVVVRLEVRDGAARVRVSDSGPGVAESVKPRLFEPFVTGKPNGVGIGLALSRNIARAHGGDLVLEDATGGAAFHLRLPLEAS